MKVSELAAKVDDLIDVASELKSRADAASNSSGTGSPVMSAPQEDDPQVEQLAHRIQDAIDILRGPKNDTSNSGNTVPPDNQFPNSGEPSAPSDAALATDINSPQGREPNSPL